MRSHRRHDATRLVVGKFVQTRRDCRQLVAADAIQLDSCVASAVRIGLYCQSLINLILAGESRNTEAPHICVRQNTIHRRSPGAPATEDKLFRGKFWGFRGLNKKSNSNVLWTPYGIYRHHKNLTEAIFVDKHTDRETERVTNEQ